MNFTLFATIPVLLCDANAYLRMLEVSRWTDIRMLHRSTVARVFPRQFELVQRYSKSLHKNNFIEFKEITMTAFTRRRFIKATSATSVALAAGFPAIGRAQAPIALRFSSSMVADQNAAHYVWFQKMEANLKTAVGDRIKLDYFPNNQLGKESDVVQQVKVGSIDMMVTGSSIWATVAPEFGMLDLGYLFDSYAHVAKALDGGVGNSLNTILQKRAGCNVLTWASHFGR
jgi:hypothetical protein